MTRAKDRDGIEKKGTRHYRVVIELDGNTNGKRRREYHTVHGTLEDAKQLRAKLMADKSRGSLVGRSTQPLGDYLDTWLAYKRTRVGASTHQRYTSLVASIKASPLGGLRVQQLTAQHLDSYYVGSLTDAGHRKKTTLSATTVHHRHVVLKMALKRAVELGIIFRNPADFAKPPQSKRAPLRVLDQSEAKALETLLAADPEQLPALVALRTGCRLGEVLAMRWTDLDLNGRRLTVRRTLVEPMKRDKTSATWYDFKEPKSGRERVVDLDASTVEFLKAHKKAQAARRLALGAAWPDLGLVVTSATGQPSRPSTVSKHFTSLAAEHGLTGLRFHDLRHTHATIMLALGVAPHVVSQRLGHATVAFTLDRYGHVLPGQQMAAAEAFDRAVSGA